MSTQKVPAIVLAGGRTDRALKAAADAAVEYKALIPIGGVPMVTRVVDALNACTSIDGVVLVMDPAVVPPDLQKKVRAVAMPGEKILDSVESGMRQLPADLAESGPLVSPSDTPFLTPEALEDYIMQTRLREADVWYAYLSKADSERAYPGLRHTYARMKEGWFCGTGLIRMRLSAVASARQLMRDLVAARKSPLKLAGILGLGFLFKLLIGRLSVSEAEARMSTIMGKRVVAVQTRFADAGFNVDSVDQLVMARTHTGV